jgi:hypothetical protein
MKDMPHYAIIRVGECPLFQTLPVPGSAGREVFYG